MSFYPEYGNGVVAGRELPAFSTGPANITAVAGAVARLSCQVNNLREKTVRLKTRTTTFSKELKIRVFITLLAE